MSTRTRPRPELGGPSAFLVIIPTYNEADNIDPLLDGIAREAPSAHVLFVDDNSRDQTRAKITARMALAPDKIFILKRAGKLGLGTAYVEGFAWAMARGYGAVIEMDADLSHRAVDLALLMRHLQDADVVVGSRYVDGGGTLNWNWFRKVISRLGSIYARAILRLKVRDLTGGFNGWRAEVVRQIGLADVKSEGYSFQIELKFRASLAGFAVEEVPILFEERRAGQSKMSGGIIVEAMLRVWALAAQRGEIRRQIESRRVSANSSAPSDL